jgi:hypothetical protein
MITRLYLGFIAMLFCACGVRGDDMGGAVIRVFASPDGNTLARVLPGKMADGRPFAMATILQFDPKTGGYAKTAEFPLRNPNAPYSVIVFNGAEFLVTFDDWGSVGRTNNVVVVYRGTGEFVKSWALADIFTEDERKQFGESVSSTWWRGDVMATVSAERHPIAYILPNLQETAGMKDKAIARPIFLDLRTLTFQKK